MNKGQSLFEVVIALAVITIILVSLVTLATLSIRNTSYSANRTLATRLTQQTIEWLRGERDADWNAFVSHTSIPIWCLSSLAWDPSFQGNCGSTNGSRVAGTIQKREVYFTSGVNSVQALVRVYWADAQGDHESRTSTDFTNWRSQ